MKLFIVAALFGLSAAARLDNAYLPPRGNAGSGAGAFGGNQAFGASAGGFGQKSGGSYNTGFSGQGGFGTQNSGNAYNAPAQSYNTRQQSSFEANAQILKYNSDVTAEGFSYDFETSNGIRADASGVATNGVQSQGSFGYKGDDGQDYSITYTADENGYRPQGAHLPTPPPIPEAILKSLEQNARDEAAGISDDGTYRGEGAGAGASGYARGPSNQYGAPAAPSNQYGAPAAPSNQYGAPAAPRNQYGAPSRGFQQSARPSNFGAATSRQYLTPNAGPARSGNGNFNQQTGYQY